MTVESRAMSPRPDVVRAERCRRSGPLAGRIHHRKLLIVFKSLVNLTDPRDELWHLSREDVGDNAEDAGRWRGIVVMRVERLFATPRSPLSLAYFRGYATSVHSRVSRGLGPQA